MSSVRTRGRRSLAVSSLVALFLAFGVIIAFPTLTSAHAKPTSSTPAPDSTVKEAPTSITIVFGESLTPSGSDIVVYGAKGNKVSTEAAKVDRSDLKKMTVAMKGDDSQEYLVVWHSVSADDGDPAIGSFSFTVDPKGGSATPTPATPPTTNTSNGVNPLLATLIGLLGLVVGGAGGYYLSRRQAK